MENVHQKKVRIPSLEFWDERNERFIEFPETTLVLEHSLATISKWEALTGLPFFSNENKTEEQTISYIKCMTQNDVQDDIFNYIPSDVFQEIVKFIEAPMSATWFSNTGGGSSGGGRRIITSEIVYNWMFLNNIPLECEHWHFNRLLTLIRVCNEENKPKENKKFTKEDAAARAALNRKRREQLSLKGK